MSNVKSEKIIILGQTGSGKDFLRKELSKIGLKYSPKFTTRPKRDSEVNGIDYNFIDYDLYVSLHERGEIKTFQSFNISGVNWYYGFTKENWDNNQMFIMTPHELKQLSAEERNGCFVVYLNIDIDTRRNRILERNDMNDSVQRRLEADVQDFEGFKNYDLCITDPEFEADWIYDLMN